jgi:thiamine transport system permease protein
LLFLALFYFFPLFSIFNLSFRPEGEWELDKLSALFTRNYYIRTLWFTFWQAAISTILTLAVALPSSYVFARYRFFGKSWLQAFSTIPFVLPTVVVATAFQAFLGSNGVLNQWLVQWFHLHEPPIQLNHTLWFILLAHVFFNYTVVLRIVGGFWSGLQPSLGEAASMLGASPRQVFYKVTLPLLKPAILTAGLLVFIFCFSSFGIILILGGPRFATLEVEIYRQAVHIFNLPMAAALSLVQIVFTFILMWVYTALQRKATVTLNPESAIHTQKKPASLQEKGIVIINAVFMLLLLGAPLASLLYQSMVTEDGFTLLFYRALFDNPIRSVFYVPPFKAVIYSLGFALVTLVFAVVLGLLASMYLSGKKSRFSTLLDPIFMLPLSTSAVTLGFGFIIALDEPPLNLRTSLILVPIAHTLVAFPFVVRSLLPALRSLPENLKEAAALLGAAPYKVFLIIDLPIIGRALLVGAVFAFTISLGEFGASVFVARPQTPTMPLAIYRFLSQPGAMNHGQAMAMSSLLMMVTAIGFLSLEKFRTKQIGEF